MSKQALTVYLNNLSLDEGAEMSKTALTLTLIRGLPGSGKSTLAKSLPGVHLEADMFFVDKQGHYHFQPQKLSHAHAWCQQQTEQQLKMGKSVVVANTFVELWEMQAYRDIAARTGAKLIIRCCRGNYGNEHGVSRQTIANMRQRWQE
ncbi:AAA family ATPase [Agarivorans gilvus]|uniref:AAA family ATPase n=1 Tax=Agarivorans gilvus TaxID=680279 RepID=UPI001E600D87|nr:AAA family ATPase [Agarivorans gilvus]